MKKKVKTADVPQSTHLMDQVREVLRYHHDAIRTEKIYLNWILKYMYFNETRHPTFMEKREIEGFLSDLATKSKVAIANQQ